jgi:O-antigen/teichoic acid export membrane protein
MIGFASNVAASETLAYFAANIDRLLVGKFLGATAVGIYEAAVRLMLVPVMNTSVVLGRVLYPAFARLQDDRERLKDLYLRCARLALFVSTPLLLGLTFCARPFVGVAYPPTWHELVPVLQLTAPAGLVSTLVALTTSVLRSTGRADVELRIGFTRRILGVVGPALGLFWNVVAVAFGRLVAALMGLPLYQLAVGRMLGLTVRQQLENVASLTVCGAALGLAIVVTDHLLVGSPDLVALGAEAVVGSLAYLLVAVVLRDRSWLELRDITTRMIVHRSLA